MDCRASSSFPVCDAPSAREMRHRFGVREAAGFRFEPGGGCPVAMFKRPSRGNRRESEDAGRTWRRTSDDGGIERRRDLWRTRQKRLHCLVLAGL
jgi:hypothetical protein